MTSNILDMAVISNISISRVFRLWGRGGRRGTFGVAASVQSKYIALCNKLFVLNLA